MLYHLLLNFQHNFENFSHFLKNRITNLCFINVRCLENCKYLKRKERPVQEGREPLCGALIFPGRDITMLRNHYLGVGRTREQGGEKHPERRLE
jgi:hypothetical protein